MVAMVDNINIIIDLLKKFQLLKCYTKTKKLSLQPKSELVTSEPMWLLCGDESANQLI